jgi:hypothetical protein
MRSISRTDAEAIQLANLVIRSKACEKVLSDLRGAWENNRKNPEKAFTFAAAILAYVHKEDIASEKHKHLTKAVEALNDCLDCYDDWWIARFLRSEALYELPLTSENPESAHFTTAGSDRAVLLEQQDAYSQTEPYFLCTYISISKSYIYKGEIDAASKAVETGLSKVKVVPVQYPLNSLIQPFADLIILFREVGIVTLAEHVKYAGLALFPRSSTLAEI